MTQHNYEGALQKPLGSGFNATSTTHEVMKVIDLTGVEIERRIDRYCIQR